MADTRIVGDGVLGTWAGQVWTPDAVIDLREGETWLVNVDLNEALPIASSTDDGNGAIRTDTLTITGDVSGWTDAHRYCVALSEASKDLVYTGLPTANAAAATGDKVCITEDAKSGYFYSTTQVSIGVALTMGGISADKYPRIYQNQAVNSGGIRPGAAVAMTIKNMHLIHSGTAWGGCFYAAMDGASGTLENMILETSSNGVTGATFNLGTWTVNNVSVPYASYDNFNVQGTAVTFNYCHVQNASRSGYRRSGGAVTCNNCSAIDCTDDYYIVSGGKNNAASDGTPPGTNPVTSTLTEENGRFAYVVLPGHPYEWRVVDREGSPLENAGDPVDGVTYDMNGRTRDGTTPNVGPTEGFTGFGGTPDYPDRANVTEDDTVNSLAGLYHEATEAEVQEGVTFGASSGLTGTYAAAAEHPMTCALSATTLAITLDV